MAQRSSRPSRPRRRDGIRRKRVCAFCVEKKPIDYKNHEMLRRYVTEHGHIRPRRATGTCARHQRWLATAIKRARHIALLPFVAE